MFERHPLRKAVGHRVVAQAYGDTWRGRLTQVKAGWLTLTDAEYLDAHGTQNADGEIMLPEQGIDYVQVITDKEETS
ncbi:hypothetical protein [Bifidobacterium pseudolongum]|uniref:hypothetical protein n=1 Tax=Bifidobacterium pseudolongum TaxID=1694 RepID=UPI0010D709B7|nr:hypothetical protein [Bifidobacterium pseudolongum]RYQ74604.1 hypothetical protein PG2012B_0422 [Bifidobacterium pseudolongum subsp. globosum]